MKQGKNYWPELKIIQWARKCNVYSIQCIDNVMYTMHETLRKIVL